MPSSVCKGSPCPSRMWPAEGRLHHGQTRTLNVSSFIIPSPLLSLSLSPWVFICLSVWCSCTLVFTVQTPSQRSGGWGPRAGEHRPLGSSLEAWECWWLLWWSGCSGSSGVLAHRHACSDWSGYVKERSKDIGGLGWFAYGETFCL